MVTLNKTSVLWILTHLIKHKPLCLKIRKQDAWRGQKHADKPNEYKYRLSSRF